jgi:beta-barrel assembly-enhancing protease
MKRCLRRLSLLLAVVAAAVFTGCSAMQAITEAGTSVAVGAGVMTEDQAKSANTSVAAVVKATEALTPENEYYIGRAVGASVLASYKPYDSAKATRYINTLGQALALVSDMPQTFGGYHYLILNSDEINAFAAPGGLIFVTRGMLRCCKDETSLAGVLAHEVGHVELKHGLGSIKKGRITQATVTVLSEGTKAIGGENMKMLTEQFQGSIDDITKTMVVNGYSRGYEKDADAAAVTILTRIGYNPSGLVEMLTEMKSRVHEGGPGFGKTHPPPEDRIALIEKQIGKPTPIIENAVIKERFAEAMNGI